MRIVFSSVEHDRYDPRRGKSFEYHNFYLSLQASGHEVRYVPFDRILAVGKRGFNRELLSTIAGFKPDLFFAFPYTDELDPLVLSEVKKRVTSIAWFSDDSWRFWNYSRFLAPCFSWVITTYSWLLPLYKKYGQPNVVRSQWAANTALYHPVPGAKGVSGPDVSFVGGYSRPRFSIINALRGAGIQVETYGAGWPDARRLDAEEMVRLFSASAINLALNPPPGRFNMNSLGRLFFRKSVNRIVPDFRFYSNIRSWLSRDIPQVKARHFEIPACGGFLMTSLADDLNRFYAVGKEIVTYEDTVDLFGKIRYYLRHDGEREVIARRGYERTVREHTYAQRFNDIFRRIGV